jgi:hypothetical protein
MERSTETEKKLKGGTVPRVVLNPWHPESYLKAGKAFRFAI